MVEAAELVPLDDPGWNRFVAEAPDSTAFHDPAWASLLASCYGFRAFAVVQRDDEGRIAAGVPVVELRRFRSRRWVSLPFTDACSPLATSGEVLDSFARRLDAARAAASVARVEVRGLLPGAETRVSEVDLVHTLRLATDPEAVFRTFKRSQVQRNVARAERDGVEVRMGEDRSDLVDVFYRLHVATRRRLGVPVQPRSFFELLWGRLLSHGRGFVLLASADGRDVAGAVFLTSASTTTYKFGASDASFWGLRPNHALMWAAIRWSCLSGRRKFDFGRTETSNRGLVEFKRGWGTVEAPVVYSTLGLPAPAERPRSSSGLAAAIIRRSPPVVCRAVGRTLYRYAA